MKRRLAGALVALALVAALARAYAHLPQYGESRGPYERLRAIESVREGAATNLDAFVNFDLRGFDTLGEEFIFLVAIAGFSLILRERRRADPDTILPPSAGRRPDDDEVEIRTATPIAVGLVVAFGLYVVVHGQLTPGGGFQGGATLATGALAVALGAGYRAFGAFFPKDGAEAVEAVGALSYVAIGASALVASGVFLSNFLPHGSPGALLSSGTILALNDGVGIAIAGGFVVLFAEFEAELLAERPEPDA